MRRWRQKQIERIQIAATLKPPMARMYLLVTKKMQREWEHYDKLFRNVHNDPDDTNSQIPIPEEFHSISKFIREHMTVVPKDSNISEYQIETMNAIFQHYMEQAPPMFVIDAQDFRKLKDIQLRPNGLIPVGSYVGVDIAAHDSVDESAMVTAKMLPNGKMEVISVERFK